MADDASLTITLDPQTSEQLAALARQEGVTPEALAAELLAGQIAMEGSYPPLSISDEELRASIEQQRRDIAAGTAKLHEHDEVMAGARAILAKAREPQG